jgi:hypothetical protein
VHGERVAGLGTLHIERSGLRVHERKLDHPGHDIVDAAHPTGETVFGE